jgi:hypothetical protein
VQTGPVIAFQHAIIYYLYKIGISYFYSMSEPYVFKSGIARVVAQRLAWDKSRKIISTGEPSPFRFV